MEVDGIRGGAVEEEVRRVGREVRVVRRARRRERDEEEVDSFWDVVEAVRLG